jgi:hypothetical protein
VVCLDSENPETHVEFSKANWYGGVEGAEVGNRWYIYIRQGCVAFFTVSLGLTSPFSSLYGIMGRQGL